MWKSIRTGRVLTSIFEQSNIVISVRVRATVTGVHNLNSSSFCDDIEMNYRAYRSVCQGSKMLLWIKKQSYRSSVRTVPGNSDSSRRVGILEGFPGCCWGSYHEAAFRMFESRIAPYCRKRYAPLPGYLEEQALRNRRCCFAEKHSYLL